MVIHVQTAIVFSFVKALDYHQSRIDGFHLSTAASSKHELIKAVVIEWRQLFHLQIIRF